MDNSNMHGLSTRRVSIETLETRTFCSATAPTSGASLVQPRDVSAADESAVLTLTGPTDQWCIATMSKGLRVGTLTAENSTGPFKANINWGDGHWSHNTFNNTGGIPLGVHIYPKAGKFTVTEYVSDSLGNVSNTVSYVLTVYAPATISGRVYIDANRNGKLDANEAGLKATVFFDNNKDGKLEDGENYVQVSDGKFSLGLLKAGTYYLRVIPASGYVATNPTTNLRTITVAWGQISLGNNFGERKK